MRIFNGKKGNSEKRRKRGRKLTLAAYGILTFAMVWSPVLLAKLAGVSEPGPWIATVGDQLGTPGMGSDFGKRPHGIEPSDLQTRGIRR